MVRIAVAAETPLGLKNKEAMDKVGTRLLVLSFFKISPLNRLHLLFLSHDCLICRGSLYLMTWLSGIIHEAMKQPLCEKRFIFDGFHRTVLHAQKVLHCQ